MRAETKSLNRPLPRDVKKSEVQESALDHALEETFPASDPIAVGPATTTSASTYRKSEEATSPSETDSKNLPDPKKCETEDPFLQKNETELK